MGMSKVFAFLLAVSLLLSGYTKSDRRGKINDEWLEDGQIFSQWKGMDLSEMPDVVADELLARKSAKRTRKILEATIPFLVLYFLLPYLDEEPINRNAHHEEEPNAHQRIL